ncbi:hypothetical protein [Microbacterium hydrocarbonoxydans]|uniref:hypothetical protein n=1 Tax=Microbacterium hydrocarbonoxydans TaxID=273678 RepID=UPI003D95891F
MGAVRAYLAPLIRPEVEALGWIFHDHDRSLPTVGKPTALLVRTRVEPGPQQGSLTHTVQLVVVEPSQVEERIENDLDGHLDDLIPILEAIPPVQFVSAEPGTREERPCWLITLTVQTTA